MTPRDQAEAYLEDLSEIRAKIRSIEERMESDLEAIRARYAPLLNPLREEFGSIERDLMRLMRKRAGELFDGQDKIALPHGVLIFGEEWRLRLPKDALERIKELGWIEAVKVVESVDRGIIGTWPESRLAAIGAERRLQRKFSYELKGAK